MTGFEGRGIAVIPMETGRPPRGPGEGASSGVDHISTRNGKSARPHGNCMSRPARAIRANTAWRQDVRRSLYQSGSGVSRQELGGGELAIKIVHGDELLMGTHGTHTTTLHDQNPVRGGDGR
jgi:hypothetical protein